MSAMRYTWLKLSECNKGCLKIQYTQTVKSANSHFSTLKD